MAATYLDRILAAHRARVAADDRDLDSLAAAALACAPTRGLTSALRDSDGVAVIAEVKRWSPSKGALAPDLDPASVASAYQNGGATALSVLTDEEFFHGSQDDLQQARAATGLPVLRKDFTVGPADVFDARCMGADGVLLIAAALSPDELVGLTGLSRQIGIDALVEVHDENEAERALAAGATVIGVNQRDLYSFEVDEERAVRVGRSLPADVVRVAESGIRSPDVVRRLGDAGFDAVLVGEALVTSVDPAQAVRELRGVER